MKLAMLGLGAMGARMARRAVDGGVQVITWNRSARHVPGATVARSPREAAAAADVVVSMVTDVEASRAVWLGPDGARSGLREGALAVEASTVTPAWSVGLARAVEAGGARYLEAPVVGTRPHAEQGLLTVLAGGAQADVAAAEPVLTTWGKVVHAGPVGAAMPLKLAINTLFAAQVGLLAEALALLTGAGIDDERALTHAGVSAGAPGHRQATAGRHRRADVPGRARRQGRGVCRRPRTAPGVRGRARPLRGGL